MIPAVMISNGLYWLDAGGANCYLVEGNNEWVLVDAGWRRSATAIDEAARRLLGDGRVPAAIIGTHAHPDHIGGAKDLALRWRASLYLHPDDMPIVSEDIFALGDQMETFGRWFLALRPLMPETLRARVREAARIDAAIPLDPDADAPHLPGWRIVHTPGHMPGHICLFRPSDGALIAGDALLTEPTETWFDVLLHPVRHPQRLSLPLRSSCWNWALTLQSVDQIAALSPRLVAAGHGKPMGGDALASALPAFAARVRSRLA